MEKVFTKDNYILFLLGCIVLSPISTLITLTYFHLPLALPELLLIPFIPFLKKNFEFPNIFHKKQCWFLIMIWSTLVIIGILNFNPFAVLSTARTWLYIFLCFCLFNSRNVISIDQVSIVALGSVLGWLFVSVISFNTMLSSGEITITYGPMIAVAIIISYYTVERKYYLLILMTTICIILGFISGLRRELAILTISLFGSLMLLMILKPSKYLKYLGLPLLISFLVILFYEDLSLYLNEHAPFIYERMVIRIEKMFDGSSNDGDISRITTIKTFFNSFIDYIIPRGFVSKQFSSGSKDVIGAYNDVPITELATTYGIIITICIVVYFIIANLCVLKIIFLKQLSKNHIIIVIGGIVMITLLLLEGTFLTYAYCAPYTGYLLGSIQYYSKLRFKFNKL